MKYAYNIIAVVFLFLIPLSLHAHAPNQSYIFLKVYENDIKGIYEINVQDLNKVFPWNLPKEGNSVESIKQYQPQIKEYVKQHLSFSSVQGEHPIELNDFEAFPTTELGDYFLIYFDLKNVNTIPDDLIIKYDGILEKDKTHRGLQVIAYNWKAGILDNEAMVSLTFSPENIEQSLSLTDDLSLMNGFIMMVESGIHHIRIGLDHILFLIALILPGVVRRRRKEEFVDEIQVAKGPLMKFSAKSGIWQPVERFKPALIYVLTIVTFFTIAHSITLSLAALDIVRLPSRMVESVIAVSIALAAYHNIRPIFKRDWMIAFLFGLFHGFGFASVLGEVGLAGEYMLLSLVGFNVGVEVGQIIIIAMVFPVLYFIRNLKIYPRFLIYSSVLLMIIAFYWIIERVFDVELPVGDYIYPVIRSIF